MTTVLNPISKLPQFNINGTLKSMGSSAYELKNAKKTKYRLCTVQITIKGVSKLVTAQVWEKSVPSVQAGEIYSVTGTIMPTGRVLFQLNSITVGEVLTAADFGLIAAATPAVAAVSSEKSEA